MHPVNLNETEPLSALALRRAGLWAALRAPARPRARVPTDGRLEPELAAHRTGDARLRDCTPDIRT